MVLDCRLRGWLRLGSPATPGGSTDSMQAITPKHPVGADADLLAREPPPNRGVLKRSLAWCRRQSVAADRLSPALGDPAWQVPTLAAMFKGRRAWELESMQEI